LIEEVDAQAVRNDVESVEVVNAEEVEDKYHRKYEPPVQYVGARLILHGDTICMRDFLKECYQVTYISHSPIDIGLSGSSLP
jgi:hypothetical protein